MYLFDTNAFRLYIDGDRHVVQRVLASPDFIRLSSVAVEEMLGGRLSIIQRARGGKTPVSLAQAHEDLVKLVEDVQAFPIVAYSELAEQVFRSFPASIRRIGSQDCRIAAQAIAHGMTVVTRNIGDFKAIGAACEDWSLPL